MQRVHLALCLLISLTPARADTVLALPFFSLSPAAANVDWISQSISETVREAVQSRGHIALSRADREEAYRRLSIRPQARLTRASVIKVAEALDAGIVVYGELELTPAPEGSPAGSRGSLRITGSVLDMTRLKQGESFTETGTLEDLSRLQSRIALRVLERIDPNEAPSEEDFRRENPPVRLDAMENYIRGLLAANPDQKHRFFTQAALLEPEFAQPVFELGRFHWDKEDYRLAAQWFGRVKPPSAYYLEATFFLGLSKYYTGDFEGAQAAFEIVAAQLPLNEVFNNLGAAQSRRNDPQAAVNFAKALEGDDSDPEYHFNVGLALWKKGDYNGAVERFRAVLDRDPEDAEATLMLGRALKGAGPRPGDEADGMERLKHNFEERAYRELKATIEGKRR